MCIDQANEAPADLEVCTTPELLDKATLCTDCDHDVCRECPGGREEEEAANRNQLPDMTWWRCDSGACIHRWSVDAITGLKTDNLRDGKPDCLDGSDERRCKSIFLANTKCSSPLVMETFFVLSPLEMELHLGRSELANPYITGRLHDFLQSQRSTNRVKHYKQRLRKILTPT